MILHSYGTTWNTTHHWHECDCGDKVNIAIHSLSDWITTTPATYSTVGIRYRECSICGYIFESEIIPVLANPDNNNTNNNSSKPDDKSSSNNVNKNNNNNGNIANPSRNTPTYYSNQISKDSYTNDSNNTTEEKNITTTNDSINTGSEDITNNNLNLAIVLIAVFLLVGVGIVIVKMRK